MPNKKLIMFAIILFSLLALLPISAADNATSDVSCIKTADDAISVNESEVVNADDLQNVSISDNPDVSAGGDVQDEISSKGNVLSSDSTYPSYSDYSVRFSDNIVKGESSVSISMIISPASGSTYKYYYYLKVYDIDGNEKVSQLFYGTNFDHSKSYIMTSNQLDSGNTYTMKIINYCDNREMASSMLIVNFPPNLSYSDYSVNVSDTIIDYECGGYISMSISPAYSPTYKYYYYLKVYDSEGSEKISKLYQDTNYVYSKSYIINPYQLSPGTYTIKIINYNDGQVMDTARLNAKINTYVSGKDISAVYGYGKNLIATLKDANNEWLSDKTLSVKLNGRTFTGKTDSNGQVSVKLPASLAPKTYSASIAFAGDDGYISSFGKVNVEILKRTPKITVKAVTGNPAKKVKLSASVVDDFGNPISKCTVTFKVDGKKYTAKTNSKGIASLKVKTPKSKRDKVFSKTKNKVVTKTTDYKKTYNCTASVGEDGTCTSGSTKFKLTSKDLKIQKYKVVRKQTKTVTIPYKKLGLRKKTSGHYAFAIFHEQLEINRISVFAGDKTLNKLIKFSSKAYFFNHGKKVYLFNKWVKSKHDDDVHYYTYTGDAKIYVTVKYDDFTYKKIR